MFTPPNSPPESGRKLEDSKNCDTRDYWPITATNTKGAKHDTRGEPPSAKPAE
jgi:hypothetical protein